MRQKMSAYFRRIGAAITFGLSAACGESSANLYEVIGDSVDLEMSLAPRNPLVGEASATQDRVSVSAITSSRKVASGIEATQIAYNGSVQIAANGSLTLYLPGGSTLPPRVSTAHVVAAALARAIHHGPTGATGPTWTCRVDSAQEWPEPTSSTDRTNGTTAKFEWSGVPIGPATISCHKDSTFDDDGDDEGMPIDHGSAGQDDDAFRLTVNVL